MAKKVGFKKSTESATEPGQEGADRFAAADAAMAGGGYAEAKEAKKTKPSAAGESTRQPTSWLASQRDRELLHQLQGSLMMAGHKVTQTQILALGLEALKRMNADERAAIFNEIFG